MFKLGTIICILHKPLSQVSNICKAVKTTYTNGQGYNICTLLLLYISVAIKLEMHLYAIEYKTYVVSLYSSTSLTPEPQERFVSIFCMFDLGEYPACGLFFDPFWFNFNICVVLILLFEFRHLQDF